MSAFSETEKPPKQEYGLTRRGCTRGCMLFLMALLLVYIVSVATALITVETNYARWMSHGITSYSVIVNYGYSVGVLHSQLEIVEDGKLVTSNPANAEPSIDRLFKQARVCAFGMVLGCQIEYEPKYDYPQRVSINDLDLGDVTEIVDFALRPAPVIEG